MDIFVSNIHLNTFQLVFLKFILMPIYNLYTSTIPFFFFILYDSIKLNYVNNQYLTIIKPFGECLLILQQFCI